MHRSWSKTQRDDPQSYLGTIEATDQGGRIMESLPAEDTHRGVLLERLVGEP